MTNGSANYFTTSFVNTTYFTTQVGAYDAKPSDSAYGTFDQGGNLWELNEALVGFSRGSRGGSFHDYEGWMSAASRGSRDPTLEGYHITFRVAAATESAPVPAVRGELVLALAVLCLTTGALLIRRRQVATGSTCTVSRQSSR